MQPLVLITRGWFKTYQENNNQDLKHFAAYVSGIFFFLTLEVISVDFTKMSQPASILSSFCIQMKSEEFNGGHMPTNQ